MATAKKPAERKPEAETAKRSADGSDGARHVKEFVVARPTLPSQDGPEHDNNKAAVAQEAIQRGLHPRGVPRFDGVEDEGDGVSRKFTYSVEVVPASMDAEPQKTTTPRDIVMDDDARARELGQKKAGG
jgi:hypothetical protein